MRKDAKIKTARRFRRALTKPELWLWLRLRKRITDGFTFRQQHPIGPYILDFYCAKAMLCVEVDGQAHSHDSQIEHDTVRDQWLTDRGIYVHRIVAGDLLADPDGTAEGVINLAVERIREMQDSPSHHPSDGPPSPHAGRAKEP